jgi:hypothetical protein
MATKQPSNILNNLTIPLPLLNVDLHVLPDFTGRVVLYIEKGIVKCDRRLRDEEHICALGSFIEMAREAGWPLQRPNS